MRRMLENVINILMSCIITMLERYISVTKN